MGAVILAYDRPRPPCNYLQTITQPGMTRALAGGRSGICARVIKGEGYTSGGVPYGITWEEWELLEEDEQDGEDAGEP